MTQNASTRGETACLQSENAFFNFTEAIRDNSSLLEICCGRGSFSGIPAARTAGHKLHNALTIKYDARFV